MAGRRPNYGGWAAGLNVLSQGIAGQYGRQQQLQDEQRRFEQKLRLLGIAQQYGTSRALALQQARSGAAKELAQIREQGQTTRSFLSPQAQLSRQRMDVASQLAPLPEGGFAPSEVGSPQANLLLQNRLKAMQDVGVVPSAQGQLSVVPTGQGRTSVQREAKAIDPVLRAQRIAGLSNQLQQIEQRNALAPMLASAAYQHQYPPPILGVGGYIDPRPNWFQSMLGEQQRPAAPAVPTADTAYLRRQLGSLTGEPSVGQVSSAPQADLRQQAIQELQAAGAPVTEANIQEAMRQLSQGR